MDIQDELDRVRAENTELKYRLNSQSASIENMKRLIEKYEAKITKKELKIARLEGTIEAYQHVFSGSGVYKNWTNK